MGIHNTPNVGGVHTKGSINTLVGYFLSTYRVGGVEAYITHDTSIGGFIRVGVHTPSFYGEDIYSRFISEEIYLQSLLLAVHTFMNESSEDLGLIIHYELLIKKPFSYLLTLIHNIALVLDNMEEPFEGFNDIINISKLEGFSLENPIYPM